MRDLPLPVPLEQSKNVGCVGVGPGQLTRPMLYFKVNHGDTLDDLDAREAGSDIRCRTVFVDPVEDMFYRTGILHSLAVPGDGGSGMKSGTHEVPITCACSRDVAVHGASDRVMFTEVRVGNRFRGGKIFGFAGRGGAGTPGSEAAPGLDLVLEGEDGVLFFVLAAVDG